MYVAALSREERPSVLLQAIRDIQFGALVAVHDGELQASHIPMVVHETADGVIYLEGHVARPNPLSEVRPGGSEAMAIFQGPQAYIHPGWYPTKKEHGRAVPTWNYIAVHAHGRLATISDEDWLRGHLSDLTTINEAHRSEPWALSDAPDDYIQAMLRGIVGVRLQVRRLQGNWKMGQRQPVQNRRAVIEALASSPNAADREVGLTMESIEADRAGRT